MLIGFGAAKAPKKFKIDLEKANNDLKSEENNHAFGAVMKTLRNNVLDSEGESVDVMRQDAMSHNLTIRGYKISPSTVGNLETSGKIADDKLEKVKRHLKDIFSIADNDIEKLEGKDKENAQNIANMVDNSVSVDLREKNPNAEMKDFDKIIFNSDKFKMSVHKLENDMRHSNTPVSKGEMLRSIRESLTKPARTTYKVIGVSAENMNKVMNSLGQKMDSTTYKSLERTTEEKDSDPEINEQRNNAIAALDKHFNFKDNVKSMIENAPDNYLDAETRKYVPPEHTNLTFFERDDKERWDASKLVAKIRVKLLSGNVRDGDGENVPKKEVDKIKDSLEVLDKLRKEDRAAFMSNAKELIKHCQDCGIIEKSTEESKGSGQSR